MKKLIKSLCFIFIIGITCFSLIGCKNSNVSEEKNNYDLMISETESSGINLKMEKLAASFVSEPEQKSSQVRISATINPDNAVNKKLTWSLSWASSKSESVSNYVTYSVSSDTLTCTLNYIKNFNTQIILTAISVANSSIKATCTVDCYKRTEGIDLSLYIDFNGPYLDLKPNSSNVIDYSENDYFPDDLNDVYIELESCTENLTRVGTAESTYTIHRYIEISSSLRSALINKGISCNGALVEVTVDFCRFREIFDELCTINSEDNFKLALANTSDWFIYYVVVEDNCGNEYSKTYSLKGFNYSASEIKSISFNNTSVIF